MSKQLKIFLIFLVWAVYAGALCWAWLGWYHVERVEVPLRTEIEQAIEVQNVENKFVVIEGVRFGGAGAGGIAVPQITYNSARDFLNELARGEKIYVHLELTEDGISVDKIYSSFIRDGTILAQYRDVHQKEGYWVEVYNESIIDFRKDNSDSVELFTILFGIFGVFAAFCISLAIGERR